MTIILPRAPSCRWSTTACLVPFDVGLRIELRWFAKILRSPQAAAMIRSLFVSMQELNKGARRPAAEPPTQCKRLGIVGAGFMGAGIAQVSAAAGIAVVLIDRDQETADGGQERPAQGAVRPRRQGPHEGRRARRAAGKDHAERRLRRAEGLRSGDRGGVRGPQGKIGRNRENSSRHRRQGDLRLQYFDLADLVARRRIQGSGALHRHPFLLAGRAHDAGRDHPRQANRRSMRSPSRSIMCAPSARRRSWSTIRAASTPRAWSAPICAKAI